jgi:hypothetical protein
MALIGKWKGTTHKGSQIYRVTGSDKELEEFRDHQGAYLIEEEDGTPLFFTRVLTKQGAIRFNADKETYYIEVTFESAVLLDAARRSFSSSESSEREDTVREPADLEGGKKDTKPATAPPKKGPRKVS